MRRGNNAMMNGVITPPFQPFIRFFRYTLIIFTYW
jgi:hypothetical protein